MPIALLPTASRIWAGAAEGSDPRARRAIERVGPTAIFTVDLEGHGNGRPVERPRYLQATAERAIMREDIGNHSQELSYQEFVLTPQC
jgi:hypothetical protein